MEINGAQINNETHDINLPIQEKDYLNTPNLILCFHLRIIDYGEKQFDIKNLETISPWVSRGYDRVGNIVCLTKGSFLIFSKFFL